MAKQRSAVLGGLILNTARSEFQLSIPRLIPLTASDPRDLESREGLVAQESPDGSGSGAPSW